MTATSPAHALTSAPAPLNRQPALRNISLAQNSHEQELLLPPLTETLVAGAVTLLPRAELRQVATDAEGVLVNQVGAGEARFGDGTTVRFSGPCVIYCPMGRPQSVVNTGTSVLRFVFIVLADGAGS